MQEERQLLVASWWSPGFLGVARSQEVLALFDRGTMTDGSFTVDAVEIRSTEFVGLTETRRRLDPAAYQRVVAGVAARRSCTMVYLENRVELGREV